MENVFFWRSKTAGPIFLFVLVLVAGGLFSELFQAPKKGLTGLELYQNPVPESFLKNLDQLSLSNRLGEVILEKRENTQKWYLTSPRKLEANTKVINQITESLAKIKVKKLYQKDSINISNFSLSTPLMEINLTSGRQKLKFSLGIINPIDNSAYITLDHRSLIFQIEGLQYPIEGLNISDFINSKIVETPFDEIKKVELFFGKPHSRRFLSIKRDGPLWLDSRGKELNTKTVEAFLEKFIGLKGQIILDKMNEETNKTLEKFWNSPQYSLVITDNSDKEIIYQFTSPVPAIPEVKVEKKQTISIISGSKEYPFLVDKNVLNYFSVREHKLRSPDIKKLFY